MNNGKLSLELCLSLLPLLSLLFTFIVTDSHSFDFFFFYSLCFAFLMIIWWCCYCDAYFYLFDISFIIFRFVFFFSVFCCWWNEIKKNNKMKEEKINNLMVVFSFSFENISVFCWSSFLFCEPFYRVCSTWLEPFGGPRVCKCRQWQRNGGICFL